MERAQKENLGSQSPRDLIRGLINDGMTIAGTGTAVAASGHEHAISVSQFERAIGWDRARRVPGHGVRGLPENGFRTGFGGEEFPADISDGIEASHGRHFR